MSLLFSAIDAPARAFRHPVKRKVSASKIVATFRMDFFSNVSDRIFFQTSTIPVLDPKKSAVYCTQPLQNKSGNGGERISKVKKKIFGYVPRALRIIWDVPDGKFMNDGRPVHMPRLGVLQIP